jgi:3-deoxy-manno-octulosonate cytidylyltransferase (CMP-KDO synthetase)
MSFSVIIPARFASTRLPGKPLLDIAGKPMVQHVYERAKLSNAERIIIATDDSRIADVAQGFGGEVCMTSTDHESGTDRLQEVVTKLGFSEQEIVVNVQGDEPLVPPAVINQVADILAANQAAAIATLVEKINDVEAVFDPNAVKVVLDKNNRALYFSRAPLPWFRDGWSNNVDTAERQLPAAINYYRHIGIYAYRVSFLHQFVQWPVSALELCEKLEQLRAMENGATIMACESIETIPAGIDTNQDLAKVRALFK